MGDRCDMWITLRKADLDRFGVAAGYGSGEKWWDGLDEEGNPAGVVTAFVSQANYGWSEGLAGARKGGLVFYGSHAEGSEYPPEAFAAIGRRMREVETNRDGYIVRHIDQDTFRPLDDMRHIRAFAKLRARVWKELGIGLKQRG